MAHRSCRQLPFCQALGYSSFTKYEHEGGASLNRLIDLIRRICITPFYDLVNTRVYEGISHDLALSVGGCFDPGQIRRKDWEQLASELRVNSRLFFRTIHMFSEMLQSKLDLFHREFITLYGDHPVLERINQSIVKQVRRTNTLLR